MERVEKTELPVGTEIDENILELGPGVESPDSDNVEKKTSVRERDETTSEGTWIKHKTTTHDSDFFEYHRGIRSIRSTYTI